MTKRLEPDFRLGLTGAIVSYLSWGLMPIYWNLLEGAGSVEVIAIAFSGRFSSSRS